MQFIGLQYWLFSTENTRLMKVSWLNKTFYEPIKSKIWLHDLTFFRSAYAPVVLPPYPDTFEFVYRIFRFPSLSALLFLLFPPKYTFVQGWANRRNIGISYSFYYRFKFRFNFHLFSFQKLKNWNITSQNYKNLLYHHPSDHHPPITSKEKENFSFGHFLLLVRVKLRVFFFFSFWF